MDANKLYEERLRRVNDSIALKEPDKMPVVPLLGTLPYYIDEEGVTSKDSWYNYEEAARAQMRFYDQFQPDAASFSLSSGRANELAGTKIIDWPGKPGTPISDQSSHQVIEYEFMFDDEYPEFIHDFTGFMLRKYIPRAYPELNGLESLSFNPARLLGASDIKSLYSRQILETYKLLAQIAEEENKKDAVQTKYNAILAEKGFPPLYNGGAEVPFDIISDYYRGTMGMFEDQLSCPELVLEACEMLVDVQLRALKAYSALPLPVKRVFIPLHKGMDGFISYEQYESLYWAPFQKLLAGMIDLGIVPYIYTEGPYHTRVNVIKENLQKLPKGSCILHFEQGDFVRLKKEFGDIACLTGGLHTNLLAFGTKQEVIDGVKYLVDNVAPGGGYMFNPSAMLDNAKRENIEAMYETAHNYGKAR